MKLSVGRRYGLVLSAKRGETTSNVLAPRTSRDSSVDTLEPEAELANRLVREVPGAYALEFDAAPNFAIVLLHFRDDPDQQFRGESFLEALRVALVHHGLRCEL